MMEKLLSAIRVLDQQATQEDLLEACRRLFIHSDEYTVAMYSHPYDRSEVDAVANAIFEFITTRDKLDSYREIRFRVSRPLVGQAIEYNEFASRFSEDMLYQNWSEDSASLSLGDLRQALKTSLVGILFRYRYCVSSDLAAFPVSIILRYMMNVKVLLSREQRERDWADALWTTLEALGSLELRAMDVVTELEAFTKKAAGFIGSPGSDLLQVLELPSVMSRPWHRLIDTVVSIQPTPPELVPTMFRVCIEEKLPTWELAQGLAKIPKVAMPHLIEGLKSDNIRTRLLAAYCLRQMGPEAAEAVPSLILALETNSLDVKLMAISALGKIGPGASCALDTLKKARKERNAIMRIAATVAFLEIHGGPDQQLTEYMRQSMQQDIIQLLSEELSVAQHFINLLRDEFLDVLRRAATAASEKEKE